jgi:ribosomal-protein-alanine N-acetyltransferase
MILKSASAQDAAAMARAHATSFDAPWSADDIADLLGAPGVFGLIVRAAEPAAEVLGFILARAIAGEAEILTLAVNPAARRQGLARALLRAAIGAVAGRAEVMFLEVAADNAPAIALYESAGFALAGRRRAYYDRAGDATMDALVLRKALATD